MKKIARPIAALTSALLAQLAFGSLSLAQDGARPDEADLFGEEPSPPAQQNPRDDEALRSSEGKKDVFESGEIANDALTLGGLFYQRLAISGQESGGLDSAPFALPLQFDAFMDARPNDRLRGFIDARLFFDAAKDQFSRSTAGGSVGSLQYASTSAAPTSLSGATLTPNNPTVVLDQAWLKFDMGRKVFVTAGRQHVKWGASRFWNPTDFLHTQRRDPLLLYDLRLGNSMVKFELPLEASQMNLYAIALFDNPVPASTVGQLGGAFRAEKVFGTTELGVELVTRQGLKPVYGADLSTPLGPFDLYAEAAYFTGAPNPTIGFSAPLTPGAEITSLLTSTTAAGSVVQVSTGATYSFGWRDNRLATVGFEYFFNQSGYRDASAYPALIFTGQYQPFYTGRQYAAFYVNAEGPDAEKRTSYTLSTLANVSDRSCISRLDFNWRVLTYLTFEAYGDVHFGTEGGEFNFALNTPAITFGGVQVPAVNIPRTIWDVGMGLRLSF